MKNNKPQQDKWLLPTSIALSVLTALYFFLLFPRDTQTVFFNYLNYIILTLIVVLASTLSYLLYQKQKSRSHENKKVKHQAIVKQVEQIIWRNRYVLQSKKSQLMYEGAEDGRAKWKQVKKDFAIKSVYPKVSKSDVPLDLVSELIEKSLTGGSIGGIKPPTYQVRDTKL